LEIMFGKSTVIAIDLAVIVVSSCLATVALLVTTCSWDGEWGWRLAQPMLLIAGLAIAALVPLALIAVLAQFNPNRS
jgi:hypothetical protein